MSRESRYSNGPFSLEQYPKNVDKDDPTLPPQMELLETDDGFKWAFRDVGLRVEMDGDVFIPESTAPTEGYVTLRRKGSKDGMINASDEREIRIYADMDSDLLALGGESTIDGENDE